jgi:hypothetical protein
MRRQLIALGEHVFEPTDEHRKMVRIMAFNDVPEARIAEYIGVSVLQLQFLFHKELRLSREQILAVAASNMFELASQRVDLGVALRANEAILKTRSPSWREPKSQEPRPPARDRVQSLTLDEVEAEIARIRGSSGDADEGEDASAASRKPH